MLDLRELPLRVFCMAGSNVLVKKELYLSAQPLVALSLLDNGLYILNADMTSIMFDQTLERCYLLESGDYQGPLSPPYLCIDSNAQRCLRFSFVSFDTQCVKEHVIPWTVDAHSTD